MEFLFTSNLLLSLPLIEALKAMHGRGVAGVEIWVEHLWDGPADLGEVRRFLDDSGMIRTVHAPTRDLNITSSNPGIRTESLRQTREAFEIAARLGAATVTLHPGRMSSSKDRPEDFAEAQQQAVAQAAAWATAFGVTVGIEAMECRPGELVTGPEELNRLLAGAGNKSCGATFDAAHAVTCCRRSRPHATPDRIIQDVCAFLSRFERIVHVHISNSDEETVHLPLARGDYDLFPVLEALQERYPGPVAVEGFRPDWGIEVLEENLKVVRGWQERLKK